MDQQKARWRAGVDRRALVERLQLRERVRQQGGIGVQGRRVRVGPVGEQGELRVLLPVGQPVPLKLLQQRTGRSG